MKKTFLLFLIIAAVSGTQQKGVYASVLLQDKVEIVKAQVIEVLYDEVVDLPGTDVKGLNQTLKIKILEGVERNKTLQIQDDYIKLKKGDIFYLNHTTRAEDGFETYIVSGPYRLPVIYFLLVFFVILVLLIGGVQGLRGLISLFGSLVLIAFLLIPGILNGYSPVLVSIVVSSLIIIIGSYVTHGFNKTTTSAVLGMILTVVVTGLMAKVSIYSANLTGFSSDEAVYLNFNLRGGIDIVGVLLGGIMIGILGVLYDAAIGQSIVVEELHHIAPHISKRKIFARAIRVGREHIGALVNTLAIAYVGTSLPLLLLFSTSDSSISEIINREIFSTEIIRTIIGSIGLVLAVPITTFISVSLLVKCEKSEDEKIIEKEKDSLERFEHVH